MNWLKAKDTDFVQIEKVSDKIEKYAVKLSPRAYIPESKEEPIKKYMKDDYN